VATVTCNDPKESNVVLQITGTVWKAIDVSPTMAAFSFPAEGQTNETRIIRIVNNLEEPLKLEEPVCTNKSFRAELKTITPGKEFELKVTAIPPFTDTYLSAPIKIKTSAKQVPEIISSAYVSVVQPISVFPQVIMLPAGPIATNHRSNVTIRNNTTNNIVLSDAAINLPDASVTIREVQPGRMYNLIVALPAGFETKPNQSLEVTVKSNHPKHPVITIPVVQPKPPTNQGATAKK